VKYFEIFRVVLEDFVGRDLVKIREKKSSTDKIKHLFGPSLNSGEKFLPFFFKIWQINWHFLIILLLFVKLGTDLFILIYFPTSDKSEDLSFAVVIEFELARFYFWIVRF
jgi:hypothetical protein